MKKKSILSLAKGPRKEKPIRTENFQTSATLLHLNATEKTGASLMSMPAKEKQRTYTFALTRLHEAYQSSQQCVCAHVRMRVHTQTHTHTYTLPQQGDVREHQAESRDFICTEPGKRHPPLSFSGDQTGIPDSHSHPIIIKHSILLS